MPVHIPSNVNQQFSSPDLTGLLPIHTRTQVVKTDEIEYFRNDPSILLMNHQDICHIINPEYERGGIQTRDFVKRIHGTELQKTLPVPFCNKSNYSEQIKPEHIVQLGKDSPFLTYVKNCK